MGMTERPTEPNRPDDTPEIWPELARYLAGEADPDQAERVRRWLEADASRGALIARLDATLARLAFGPPADVDVESALASVAARLEEPVVHDLAARAGRREPTRLRWTTIGLRAAAALALVVGGVVVWRTVREPEPAAVAGVTVHETRVGQLDSVRLADGTQVVLAPASRLTLASGYGGASREVQLSGEALFDVPHDDARPFTVRAGRAVIRDLGTTFSVRSEPDVDVRVVVTSGSVLLQAAGAAPAEGVTLVAGESGMLREDGTAMKVPAESGERELAWTTGRLIFQDAPLQRVAAELRRWYGVEIRATHPSVADRRLTAIFHGETREQVIEIVALALGASLQQRGDTILLGPLEAEGPTR